MVVLFGARVRRSLGAGLVAVALGASALLAGAPATAAADAPAPIPVTFTTVTGDSGRFYPTVEIMLGTNPDPYTVILDTGSTALVMFEPSIPGATTTDAPASVEYVGNSLSGTLSVADFSIGGATASDVAFLSGPCPTCSFGGAQGIDGVMGVGQALQVQTGKTSKIDYDWFSPLMQLDDTTLAQGFTIAFTTTAGTLTLGAPTLVTGEAGVTEIQADKTTDVYPTALKYPVYDKAVDLCWQVEDVAPLCQATTIDTGAPSGLLTGSQFAGLITPPADAAGLPAQSALAALPDGTALRFSTSSSATPFASWVTTNTRHEMLLYNSIPDGHLNTGNAFFLDRTVGYHYETGRILVQTNGTPPDAPATVTTTASDGAVTALWTDPDPDLESQPVATENRLVRVRDASGATVQRFTLTGDATSTTITGLENGRSYTVDVASANRHGISEYSSADPAVPFAAAKPALAATGLDATAGIWMALALLMAGSAAAVATAQAGRATASDRRRTTA
jgi:hypothetical protein